MAEGELANQFFSSGVHSLAPMPETGVYQRPTTRGQPSVLLPQWEAVIERWAGQLAPQFGNGTLRGVFMGDEICCHAPSCWATVLTPLSAKVRRSVLLILSG